jgi:hypothetical protein
MARVAKGISAGLDYREADAASKGNAEDNKAMITALLGGAPAPVAASGSVPASMPSAPAPTLAVPTAAAPGPDSNLAKDYRNDEPSPLDPPSGQDRTNMVATILGEEKPGSPEALGVANVIRNRAIYGGYGGDTPTAVVTAPKQFSPWNDQPGRDRMARASQDSAAVAKVQDAIDRAYGVGNYVSAGPDDPTDGKTHFYDPASMVPVNAVPAWARGKETQRIGNTLFLDEPDEKAAPVTQVASAAGAPISFAPPAAVSPAVAAVTAAAQGQPAAPVSAPSAAAPAPAVAKVASAINPAVLQAYTSPYADPSTKALAGMLIQKQLTQEKKDTYSPLTDADGNQLDVNNTTHERKMVVKAAEDPTSVREYEYYKKNLPAGQDAMPYDVWSTAKARAAATNVTTNVDMNSAQSYDKQLAEGLGKSHAALANGVEDAQTRARDIAAMQGAVDKIQAAGGTTGGMAPAARLELQKSINAGAAALGVEKPFSEDDISDKEFLTKFNRSMAGAQAKNAVGSRVTNFEMSNFLKANPGLDMSITGNQRLLGIQGQIEQRNIAVGNAIRDETVKAISEGKKIDPVTVQHIITEYDKAHHIQDPTTGQDLTQSYALPEFQTQGNNAALAADHGANLGKMQRTGTGVTWSVQP